MGKWQSSLASATPARSRVFRSSASNVLIPRSHKTTFGFPPESKYSAASSHSLIVAAFPSGGKGPKRLAFTPDGAQLWVTNSASNQATVFDAHARELIATLDMAKAPSSLYFSGDGRRLYVTNANANELTTVDVPSRKILTVVPIGTDPDGIIWSAR